MNLAVRISLLCVALISIRCDSGGPAQSAPQQLDPEVLKTFPKWSISFHAVGNFRGYGSISNTFEIEKHIVSFNNYESFINRIWPTMKWSGATSTVDTSHSSSGSSGAGGRGLSYYSSESHSYQATVTTANTISGSCSTVYDYQETIRGGGGGDDEYYSFSMKYSGIPLVSIGNDSIIFRLSGDSLRSKLSEIKRVDGETSPDYYLDDIAWDKQPAPSLTIVYYK